MSSPPPAGESEPWSEEAEISVLGAMLIDDEASTKALARLEPEDFHKGANRRVFEAFSRLNGRGRPADVTMLAEELRAAGDLEDVGGMPYLARLVDAVPTGTNVVHYAEVVREYRARRELIRAAQGALSAAFGRNGESPEPREIGERLRERIERAERMAAPADDLSDVDRLTLREALEDPDLLEPPGAVAEGHSYEGQATLFVGPPKLGKTTTNESAAAAVSAGGEWLGSPTRQGYVVWISGEGDRGRILDRLRRFGADPDYVEVVNSGDSPVEELRRLVESLEPVLVVVDTWNTWSAPLGLDGWKESEVAPPLRRIERILRESGCALVLIHHSRKADDEPMGSTAIKAWADVIRTLKPGDGPRERRIDGAARFSVPSLRYRLVESEEELRVEAVDPSRKVEEKVLDFLEAHEPATKRGLRDGVDARGSEIDRALRELEREGVIEVDRSGAAHLHRIAR